jgi:hypothetical protein
MPEITDDAILRGVLAFKSRTDFWAPEMFEDREMLMIMVEDIVDAVLDPGPDEVTDEDE